MRWKERVSNSSPGRAACKQDASRRKTASVASTTAETGPLPAARRIGATVKGRDVLARNYFWTDRDVDALAARRAQRDLAADLWRPPRKQNIACAHDCITSVHLPRFLLQPSQVRMATQQDEGGVPVAIAHEMQHFRLLELPPEIVALLEAPNPPRCVSTHVLVKRLLP